ncbi:LysR family transcriptional regulator [Lampropedia puyangensis]|uniref:LysR family transcriptional regulator n=1 Tax=Lampropedia puyangensis TaxID=1330072 RepID=A0A4S8F1E9_9BURK|nr:LysR family transcriptional regulator [Lampropedia puyangensis]THU01078.1 LysR family transcriptional regulator [Lampropedia puyangensis]
MSPFESVDLNQLRVLAALLSSRSVTRTARQLGMSQPAVSRSLAVLRHLFSDPLLVKTGSGMTLTQRAEALREPVDAWLFATRQVVRQTGAADGGCPSGPIRIASTDFGVLSVIEPAMPFIMQHAPDLVLDICSLVPESLNLLSGGAVDVVVSGFDPEPGRTHERHLFTETYCCVFQRDHPLASVGSDVPLSTEELLNWPHVLVTVNGMDVDPFGMALGSAVDQRRVAARLPFFASAPLLLQKTNALFVTPLKTYQYFLQAGFALTSRPAQVDFGTFDYWLYWHERSRRDPAIQWLLDAFSKPFNSSSAR